MYARVSQTHTHTLSHKCAHKRMRSVSPRALFRSLAPALSPHTGLSASNRDRQSHCSAPPAPTPPAPKSWRRTPLTARRPPPGRVPREDARNTVGASRADVAVGKRRHCPDGAGVGDGPDALSVLPHTPSGPHSLTPPVGSTARQYTKESGQDMARHSPLTAHADAAVAARGYEADAGHHGQRAHPVGGPT